VISFTSLVSIDEGVFLECYYMLWAGGWQWVAVESSFLFQHLFFDLLNL
jgi:hypothetical protein